MNIRGSEARTIPVTATQEPPSRGKNVLAASAESAQRLLRASGPPTLAGSSREAHLDCLDDAGAPSEATSSGSLKPCLFICSKNAVTCPSSGVHARRVAGTELSGQTNPECSQRATAIGGQVEKPLSLRRTVWHHSRWYRSPDRHLRFLPRTAAPQRDQLCAVPLRRGEARFEASAAERRFPFRCRRSHATGYKMVRGTPSRRTMSPLIRWCCVEISLSGRPSRPARAAHAPGPTAVMREALRATSAPAASESPAQARQFYADETLIPGDRRGATKSPPVRSRSPLPAIDSPRLAITISLPARRAGLVILWHEISAMLDGA
jgi:hypothetical protein